VASKKPKPYPKNCVNEVMILRRLTIGLKLLRKEASRAIKEKYNPYSSRGL
jgi:hypothetical protein